MYIYEDSDLNPKHTRVKILEGLFSGLIFEFGSVGILNVNDKPTLKFDYTVYENPFVKMDIDFKTNSNFQAFLAKILLDINMKIMEKEKNSKTGLYVSPDEFNKQRRPSVISISKKYYNGKK